MIHRRSSMLYGHRKGNRERLPYAFWGIFALALFVRVVYNLTVAAHYFPQHDSLFYQTIGFHLLSEHCFCLAPHLPTVDRPPLWPVLIAGISLLLGASDLFARLFLCTLDAATCVLIYLFTYELFSRRIALFAGIVAAIYPGLYIYTGWLYTETLYTFLLFACSYTLYKMQKIQRWYWCVVSGVLLGLLSLARPNGLLVVGLVIVWAMLLIWTKRAVWRPLCVRVLLLTGLALLIVAPWTLRNYLVTQHFVPVATGDGTVLLGAYNNQTVMTPGYVGSWINPLHSSPQVAYQFPLYTCAAPCEIEREVAFRDAAIVWIREHPQDMPGLLVFHFLNMWQPIAVEADLPFDRFPQQYSSQLVMIMMGIFAIPIFLLAVYGLFATWRQYWHKLLLVYLLILFAIIECLVFYGIPRFRAPIEPMLIVLAAGGVWSISQYKKNRSFRKKQSE